MRESPTAKSKLRSVLLRERLRVAAKAVPIVMFLLALTSVMMGGSLWRMALRARDVANAPLQTGTAVVVTMTQVNYKRGFSVNLTLRLHGRIADTNVLNSPDADPEERLIWTKVGDTVPVTYRVGKSGAIYIENWQAPPHKISLSR